MVIWMSGTRQRVAGVTWNFLAAGRTVLNAACTAADADTLLQKCFLAALSPVHMMHQSRCTEA